MPLLDCYEAMTLSRVSLAVQAVVGIFLVNDLLLSRYAGVV